MKTVSGNLITLAQDGQFDVIIHGCNCFVTMGAGIAKGIRLTFPAAWAADQATEVGDRDKLGTITWADVPTEHGVLHVINAYTQYHYKGPGPKVDYEALRSCFRAVKTTFSGLRIGYPMIGAGLAGGDWSIISAIISEELDGEDHTFVVFDPNA
ncbi:MAG: phosphatase [Bacteroidota bacterium]